MSKNSLLETRHSGNYRVQVDSEMCTLTRVRDIIMIITYSQMHHTD